MGYGNKDPYTVQINNPNLDTINQTLNTKADQSDMDNVKSSLAEKAQQTDLVTTNGNVSLKADKSYVDQQIANIGTASPKGTYASLSAIQTAFPTGTTGIYVTTDTGHWYYWNGSAWTDGGVYQATGISIANQNEINNVADISDYLIGDRTSAKLKKVQINNSDWTLDSATITTSGSNIQINATTGYYTAIYKNITKLKFKISATVTNTPFILLGIGSSSYTAIGVHTNVQRNLLEIPRAGAAYSYTNLLAEDKTLTAAAAGDEVIVELSGTWVIVSIKKVGQTVYTESFRIDLSLYAGANGWKTTPSLGFVRVSTPSQIDSSVYQYNTSDIYKIGDSLTTALTNINTRTSTLEGNVNSINSADVSEYIVGDRTATQLKKVKINNTDWTLDSATITNVGSNLQINATTGFYVAIYKNITKMKFKLSGTTVNTPFILLGIGSSSYTAIGVHTDAQRNLLEIPRAGAAYVYTNLLDADKSKTAAVAGDEVMVELSGTIVIVSIKKAGQNVYTESFRVDLSAYAGANGWKTAPNLGFIRVNNPTQIDASVYLLNNTDILKVGDNLTTAITNLNTKTITLENEINDLQSQAIDISAEMFQKGASVKSYQKKIGIIAAGQSNTDGRVPVANLPSYLTLPLTNCHYASNYSPSGASGVFDASLQQSDLSSDRWAFDLVTYYNLTQLANQEVYVMKWTQGSTSIDPAGDGTNHWTTFYEELASTDNSLLWSFESLIRACVASQGSNFDIRAMLWHQGEADRNIADKYYDNLKYLIAYCRGIVGNKRLPFITGTISHNSAQYNATIEAAQQQLASEDPYYYLIDMSGATLLDSYHFDATCSEYFGKMCYDKLIDAGVISGTKLNPTRPW
jgi:hypothetical protein